MECEKVRDQFSSLLERELSPTEERIVRNHLASCPGCQRDLEQFEKILRWLHSADQVEVPNGFLYEVLEKMEDRKGKALMNERERGGRWFDKALSLKLPIQAMAMVAVVFLVFYITKMMPNQTPSITKTAEQAKPAHSEVARSEAKKMEPEVVLKATKKGKVSEQLPLEADRLKQIEKDKPIVSGGKEEEKEFEGGVVSRVQPSEPEIVGKMADTKEESSSVAKPPKEIILKVSNQGKVLSQLNELVKQFGGEIVSAEGSIFLASLPASSFSEFEKGIRALSSSKKPNDIVLQKDAIKGLGFSSEAKRMEIGERHKLAKPMPEKEGVIVVRIVLLEE